MTDDMWKSMLSAQATWDATMGWNAVEALRKHGTPKSIMVILVGSGHVAYDLGIARQARRWFDGGIATLIPVPVVLAEEEEAVRVEQVRASYADFVWGVLPEKSSTYPTLGLSTRTAEGGRLMVIQVSEDSAAAKAGFELKDVLLTFDGQPVADRETMNALMARKAWGDAARIVVKRGDEEKTLTVYFRRPVPIFAPAPAPAPQSKDKKTPAPKRSSREE
jgi:hypothetical protein